MPRGHHSAVMLASGLRLPGLVAQNSYGRPVNAPQQMRSLFKFKRDPLPVKEAPGRRNREARAAFFNRAFLDLQKRDVWRAADHAQKIAALRLDPPRTAAASRRLARNLPRGLMALPQRTALGSAHLKRLAAALRGSPPSMAASATRLRRSLERAIPAASLPRRESSIRIDQIR